MSDTPSATEKPQIKFDKKFTEQANIYLKSRKKNRSLKDFATIIGVADKTILAWANKKKKDEQGNLTDQLARPNFHAAISKIQLIKGLEIETIKKEEPPEQKINPKQELFCQYYATNRDFFGNGVEAYAEAYDLDRNKPTWYNTAKTNAWRLLTNADILKRIRDLMELGPLNSEFVDSEMAFVIAQRADLTAKVAAMREYNKLKSRIIEKGKLELMGELTIKQVSYDDE